MDMRYTIICNCNAMSYNLCHWISPNDSTSMSSNSPRYGPFALSEVIKYGKVTNSPYIRHDGQEDSLAILLGGLAGETMIVTVGSGGVDWKCLFNSQSRRDGRCHRSQSRGVSAGHRETAQDTRQSANTVSLVASFCLRCEM